MLFRSYEAMRAGNPSPYMGYARLPGAALACGSPELLVSVDAGRVASRPIAGTRPRGSDEAADLAWARELAGDTKERAEHLMLVDLLRNDVGRVAAPGTVQVERTARYWNSIDGAERVTTRREVHFPATEDPTGETWGALLALVGKTE